MNDRGTDRVWRRNTVAAAVICALLGVLLPGAAATAQKAEKRVALVIGNSAYQYAPPLANPAGDARAIAAAFEKAGFALVDAQYDLGNQQFRRKIRQFEDEAADADIAVVYFAGYGINISGVNYLIPVDARLASDRDAADEAIPLESLLKSVERAKHLRLVILDACRDNPFLTNTARGGINPPGLAPVDLGPGNSLIAFAAKARSVALDGSSAGHSPYTLALLDNLFVPGRSVQIAFTYVRDEVLKRTHNLQEPYVYGSLGADAIALVPSTEQVPVSAEPNAKSDFDLIDTMAKKLAPEQAANAWKVYLAEHPTGPFADLARRKMAEVHFASLGPPAANSPQVPSEDQLAWNRIKESSNPADFRAFIAHFPTSPLVLIARDHLTMIEERQKAEVEQQAAQQALDEAKKAAEEAAKQRAEREAELQHAEREATAADVASAHSALPEFPWRPPAASAWYVLPQTLFRGNLTVGEETSAIISALEQSGYVERSFYGTPAGGVALITRLERINDDGSPASASERWPSEENPSSLAKFLAGLFYADPGRYRVIVFIIQDQPFAQATNKTLSSRQAEKLLPGGDNVLPPEIAARPVAKSHCTALIYEFANDGSGIHLVANSRLTGLQHLEKAGLLAALRNAK